MSEARLPLRMARSIEFRHHPTMTACWIWNGEIDKTRGPIVSYPRGEATTARAAVYRILIDDDCPALKDLCGESNCVNPHHMEELGS